MKCESKLKAGLKALRQKVANLRRDQIELTAALEISNAIADLIDAAEQEDLTLAIETHRETTRGHGSCWENDLQLWKAIDPDASYPHDDVPPWCEFMKRCAEYREGLK